MRRAFTLIELLVVIAIIAILAAILFPVFAKAKEAGKKTQCLVNVKQMAVAFSIYQSDYDDGFPNTGESNLWTGRIFRWPLMPYFAISLHQASGELIASGKSPLLYCPSDTSASRFDGTSYAYSAAFYRPSAVLDTLTLQTLYSANGCLPSAGANQCVTYTTSDVEHPATKIMLLEWVNAHLNDGQPAGPWGSANFSVPGWVPGSNRWSGARNVAFADAHGKFVFAGQQVASHLDTPDPNLTPGGIAGTDLK